jgi:hypothetical protein
MKTCALLAALILAVPTSAQTTIDFLQAGRTYTRLFYGDQAGEIWADLSPEMRDLFVEPNAILGMGFEIKDKYGVETAVVDEQVVPKGEFAIYQRTAMFQKDPGAKMVQWTFDQKGVIVGFFIRPAAPAESRFLDYKDHAALRLPFKGNWLVLSGGREVAENHHVTSLDQRFADDITAIKYGQTFFEDGRLLDQYYCFGSAIYAPADGTIVEVTDGIPDNPINAPFASPPAGNHVIIDLGNSEYLVMAHFKLGSVKVKSGQKVRARQRIASCGNSGNSPIPHLHIHLQNTPVLFKGEGLPLEFRNYLANKKFTESGELEIGQIIRDKRPKK